MIHIAQTRGHARNMAIAFIGGFKRDLRLLQAGAKADEATAVIAGGGQLKQFLFGFFNLLNGLRFNRAVKGICYHIRSNIDELAAQMQIMNGLPVIGSVDDADITSRQLRQIIIAAQLVNFRITGKEMFERNRIGSLSPFNQCDGGLIHFAKHWIIKMFGTQKLADFFIGEVITQNGGQQSLLRIQIMGR